MINKESIRDVLKGVKYPGFSRHIVSFGLVEDISVEGSSVGVRLRISTGDEKIPLQIKQAAEQALMAAGIARASVEIAV